MDVLLAILGAITVWVIIIMAAVVVMKGHITPGRRAARDRCCLEVPCSEKCARIHATRYHDVVGAIDQLVVNTGELPAGRSAEVH